MTRAEKDVVSTFDTAAGRSRPNASSPLTFWRTTSPGALTPEALEAVDDHLATLRVPHGPRRTAARAGNVAVAVAVALRNLPRRGGAPPLADAAMSRLLVLAARGDPTAATVLVHGRPRPGSVERRVRRHRADRTVTGQA